MSYQVLARKWRPRRFQTMVGQEHVLRALVNALEQQRLHHAYLFSGTRGVGKTTIARILAKCLNCETGITANPCDVCDTCVEIDQGRFVDLIEVDAASRTKVEDTRDLLDSVQYAPSRGRCKIYLIDEVHMLSGHSFNALLKTLEEPPAHVKFLLATTDPQRLPITVLSRCLQFNLKALLPEYICKHLEYILTEEKLAYEVEGLQQLSIAAKGSMRDALSLLDQAIAFGGGQVIASDVGKMLGTMDVTQVWRLLIALAARDAVVLMQITQELAEQAIDFTSALAELLSALHQIALAQALPASVDEQANAFLLQLVKELPREDVQLFYQIGLIGQRDLALAPSPRVGFEMVLLRMLAFQLPEITEKKIIPPIAIQPVPVAPLPSPVKNPVSLHTKVARPVEASAGDIMNIESHKLTVPAETAVDWVGLLPQLKLSGFSLALANNCVLVSASMDQLQLQLDPAHATLLNAKNEERLTEALHAHFHQPLRVSIVLGTPGLATPAVLQRQQQQAAQQAAEQAILGDVKVQSLVQTFDAKIEGIVPSETIFG